VETNRRPDWVEGLEGWMQALDVCEGCAYQIKPHFIVCPGAQEPDPWTVPGSAELSSPWARRAIIPAVQA
jgi:hypothetical protein